jgi:LysM repeat protein
MDKLTFVKHDRVITVKQALPPAVGQVLPPGLVGLASWEDEWVALQGETPIRPAEGYGGWEVIPASRNVGITQWTKSNPFRLTVPFMLDAYATPGGNVERMISILEKMATADGPDRPPPALRLSGGNVKSTYRAMVWVIDDIDWTDPTIHSSVDGHRRRQAGTLTLLQFVDDELLAEQSPADKQRKKSGTVKSHNTRARHGDTLEKIAARTHSKLADVRKLNPTIIDPGKTIDPGTKVKVP